MTHPPIVFHLTQTIHAIRRDIETVPPHSVHRETLLAELAQLLDMLDRRVGFSDPEAPWNASAVC